MDHRRSARHTPREREIAALLAAGLTNPEVAQRLVLSIYTVQDHLESLFEKTNVSRAKSSSRGSSLTTTYRR